MTPEEEEELKRRQLQELRAKQRDPTSDTITGCGGCLGLVLVIGFIIWLVGSCSGSNSSSSTSNNAPQVTPNPGATSYEQGRLEQKREFLAGVNESISGAMIAGNKLKYVGENVDLHCTVASIVDAQSFNAQCGEDDEGLPIYILVQYDDTSSLDKGQAVRILGTVEEPTEGVNGFGGENTFPTVKAEFME
jgi:hypothetical protein